MRRMTSRFTVFARGRDNHEGFERGRPLINSGAGFREEPQYGVAVHENHGNSVPRRGRKRVVGRRHGQRVGIVCMVITLAEYGSTL